MKIKVIRRPKGWYFKFVSRNGRTICHSEIYTRKQACLDAVGSILELDGDEVQIVLVEK